MEDNHILRLTRVRVIGISEIGFVMPITGPRKFSIKPMIINIKRLKPIECRIVFAKDMILILKI